jgi:hypothetical protein
MRTYPGLQHNQGLDYRGTRRHVVRRSVVEVRPTYPRAMCVFGLLATTVAGEPRK